MGPGIGWDFWCLFSASSLLSAFQLVNMESSLASEDWFLCILQAKCVVSSARGSDCIVLVGTKSKDNSVCCFGGRSDNSCFTWFYGSNSGSIWVSPQIYLFILTVSVFWGIKLHTLEHTYVTASSSSKEEEKCKSWGWWDGSTIKNTWGSCRGLWFGTQHQSGCLKLWFQFWGIWHLPASMGTRTHAQTQERRINEIQEGFQELERGKERLKLKMWRYSSSQLERVGEGDMLSVSSLPRGWAQAPIFYKQASPRQNKKPHFSRFVTYFLHWKH